MYNKYKKEKNVFTIAYYFYDVIFLPLEVHHDVCSQLQQPAT